MTLKGTLTIVNVKSQPRNLMGSKLTSILLHNICRCRFQNIARRTVHTEPESRILARELADLLEKKLDNGLPTQTGNGASIYKVPARLRSVEPKAYEPNIVSIGPYHHGSKHLRAMENTKWNFFRRLFDSTNPNPPNLKKLVDEVIEMEHKARGCYSEELKVSSMNFNKMMLVDSCFIVELLRETKEIDFRKESTRIKRWMLPVLQRDLIMLENQLPLFVLNKLYDLTSGADKLDDTGLKDLALQFFDPMMYQDLDNPKNGDLVAKGDGASHLLGLFRASISPTEVLQKKFPVKEPNMFGSVTDLKESGVKFKKGEKCQPLDVSFKKGVLKIAPVSMDDHKFTLFRNMVAYEQCHFACKPYVTAYIFFLERLINSAKDIEVLHYAGVMQHTLGGNKHAATLVNKLTKEVAAAVDESYLHHVLWMINCHCNSSWNQRRAKLKHVYFSNIWVTLSTIAAVVFIYLTVLQTVSALGHNDARAHIGNGFWMAMLETFIVPIQGISTSRESSMGAKFPIHNMNARIEGYISRFFVHSKEDDHELLSFKQRVYDELLMVL